MSILVANIGSTSFKYRLYDRERSAVLATGKIERIGQPGSPCPEYVTAIRQCLLEISGQELSAIGFKAVFAGPLSGARVVDDAVLSAMEEFAFFAPAHNPPYIAAMRSFREVLPDVPLVALFETAFFDQLDDAAVTYAVPFEWKETLGIRRYGFHGASHRAASEHVSEVLGRKDLRHISCHLGGSSSMAAIRNGVAIDTTFGMSPQSGLPHNNRTGDVDVFAVLYAMKRKGLDADQVARVLATESGLAGISGLSGDVRDLEGAAAQGNTRAQLALDVFVRSIRHYLGAFLYELGGLDVLTFSGGIGENSAWIRDQVCVGLKALAPGPQVLIVPADEERIVARATAEIVARRGGAHA